MLMSKYIFNVNFSEANWYRRIDELYVEDVEDL